VIIPTATVTGNLPLANHKRALWKKKVFMAFIIIIAVVKIIIIIIIIL
jgi:hypothetical protein